MIYNIDCNKYFIPGNVLLTPNQRLSRKILGYSLARTFDINGQKSLSEFHSYSFADFIDYIFNLILENGISKQPYSLINQWQREIVIKDIIKNININNSVDGLEQEFQQLAPDAIYSKLEQAWNLAADWSLDWQRWVDYPQPESKIFVALATEYDSYLKKNNYIDCSSKLKFIISQINSQLFNVLGLSCIDLYGFDDFSPIQIKFLQKLKQYKICINILNQEEEPDSKIKLFTANSIEQEYYAVALWARKHYENSIDNIGIVVPKLTNHRDKLIKIFEEVLPERQSWNISGGDSLFEQPIIKAAISLLNLVYKSSIELSEAKLLFRSDYYLKYTVENTIELNAVLDQFLQKMEINGYQVLNLNSLYMLSDQGLERFIDNLQQCINFNNKSKYLLPSDWAYKYSDALFQLGWPAGDSNISTVYKINNISSSEFQAINQFNSILAKTSELDKVYGSVNSLKVLNDLIALLKKTPFQIQTDNNKIDIFGMLEGAGIIYDKLWLFNFTSEVWPEAPEPNPFIPIEIQRQHNLPHATSEREFDYANKLTSRYKSSSNDIIVSYNKLDCDKENKLSLLLEKHIDKNSRYDNLDQEISNVDSIYNKTFNFEFKYINDYIAPKIDRAKVKSGVKTLGLQAICPFRAFAEIRLNAVNNYKLDIGPASWLRGQLVHKALENVFTRYNSKKKLCELASNDQTYKDYLNKVITFTLDEYKIKFPNIFTKGINIIEYELLYKLINNWLQFELSRDEFEVVELEKKYLVKLGKIQFDVRVDRVDRILYSTNNEYQDSSEQQSLSHIAIIDYKTTKQNINNLLSEDLTDPQLPVYLRINQLKQANAIIFAEILEEDHGLKGISNTSLNLPGCVNVDNWDNLMVNWHETIDVLAKDFSDGLAKVEPINKNQVCVNCHLDTLCRKDELCLE